jgi:hypothetical protein
VLAALTLVILSLAMAAGVQGVQKIEIPAGWIPVGEGLAIQPLEDERGHKRGRLMIYDDGLWEPIYIESLPEGIQLLESP